MTPARRDQILAGQTNVARKVYEAVTADPSASSNPAQVATQLKATTGAGCDIHTLRGCLKSLKEGGLIREVVPGSFRQTQVKEQKPMSTPKAAPARATSKPSAIEALGGLAAKVREAAGVLGKIADEIDTVAIGIDELSAADREELKKLRQMRDSFKSLMG